MVGRWKLVLPLSLLIVIVGGQSLHWVGSDGDHSLDLGLQFLLVSDGVGKLTVDERLHPQVAPDAKADADQSAAQDRLPLTSRSLNLC